MNEEVKHKEDESKSQGEVKVSPLTAENKSMLMTTAETSNNMKMDGQSLPEKIQNKSIEYFYSEKIKDAQGDVFQPDTIMFDKVPNFESEKDLSKSIEEYSKDHEVVINVSHLDVDGSLVQGVENMETIFKNSTTESDLIESGKRLSTEMTYISDNNKSNLSKSIRIENTTAKENEKVRLLKKESSSCINKAAVKILLLLLFFFGLIGFSFYAIKKVSK